MPAEPLRDARAMIVDDERANLLLLERRLAGWGCRDVVGVSDSSLALEVFVGFEPDLVLLDLHMPPPDGYELLAALGRERLPQRVARRGDSACRPDRRSRRRVRRADARAPYKSAWEVERAVSEIVAQSGRHSDPRAVDAFTELDHKSLLSALGTRPSAELQPTLGLTKLGAHP